MSGTHEVFQHKTGISGIYALIDPRDKAIRYIGISVDIIRRFKEHLQFEDDNAGKNAWLRDLQEQGIQPILAILEMSSDALWHRERYWIDYYRKRGEPLTNFELPNVPDFWMHGLDDEFLEARLEP